MASAWIWIDSSVISAFGECFDSGTTNRVRNAKQGREEGKSDRVGGEQCGKKGSSLERFKSRGGEGGLREIGSSVAESSAVVVFFL